jgi:hypothetical protein
MDRSPMATTVLATTRRQQGWRKALILLVALALALLLPGRAWASEHVEVAEAGGLSATFEYEQQIGEYNFQTDSNLTLAISRSGSVVYSAPIASRWCVEVKCVPAYEGPDLHIATLEQGQSPVVVLDLYTGGAHCCYISQVFSGPGANGVTTAEYEFGDPRGRLKPLGPEGTDVFVSADDRFAYAFTDYGDSGKPLQIWALEAGTFRTVTRNYPALIAADAAEQWHYFKARRKNDVGFFAAWAADEEMLRHGALVSRTLARELRASRLRCELFGVSGKRFAHDLSVDLRRWGYT